ncbi:MAG: type IV pilin [Asgard group archaeon]|nr:type IV pilin [Asgard group archaeon]
MLKTIKRLIRRRKAVSPVIATVLIIALTVLSVSFVYFIIIPLLNQTSLFATVHSIKDTNKDSRYDTISLYLTNSGTTELVIESIIIWTCPSNETNNQSAWISHNDWNFTRTSGPIVQPNDLKKEVITGNEQIELSIGIDTFYRLEIYYSGHEEPYLSEWALLNDQVDFSDLLDDFENFELLLDGLEGSIDVPGWNTNNYDTFGGPVHGPLIPGQYIYLPVIGEDHYVKFFFNGQIVIFHSSNGGLTTQPTQQLINRTDDPFRANKLFLLGMAGSWGDEFPNNAWALRVTITYTDDTTTVYNLGHDYIDDWWYGSNAGGRCVSARYGKITEIDLGYQLEDPYEQDDYGEHIHTHTAGFIVNIFKYIKSITFTDPGNDQSGPHLLSISAK